MSGSAETPSSLTNGTSPPAPDGSNAPPDSNNAPSPDNSSPPGGDSPPPAGGNTEPSPPSSSPPPSSNSPPPSSPPPSPPPPSKSKSSPPPSPSPPPPSGGSDSPEASPPPPPSLSPPSPTDSSGSPAAPAPHTSPPPSSDNPSPPPPPIDPSAVPPPSNATSTSGGKNISPPPPSTLLTPPTQSTPKPTPPSSPDAASPKTTPTSGLTPPPGSRTTHPSPDGSHGQNSNSNSTGSRLGNPSASTPSPAGGGSQNKTIVVSVTVAGVLIIAFIAIFFVTLKRRKKRRDPYDGHYMPPHNFPTKQDGFYYGQTQNVGHSGPQDTYYGFQSQQSSFGYSYGSQTGPAYPGGGSDSGVISGGKSIFSYEELMEITSGFSRQNVIGEGGFGRVYKGSLLDGKVVAIKQLKAGSGQGDREFKAEVEIISRVHHRHLVSLVGYCITEQQRLLIYEFVPNNTLEHHLHAKGLPVLDWPKRVKIAIGAAKGLAYLHEDCNPKIIHRDIKSANILLDDDFEAQVADFGLARLNDTTESHVSTRVMGTFGYLAPEYASSGKLTDRSDVFSFGVVLLELITGRKPVDSTQPLGDESLVEWARPLLIHALETGDPSEILDPRLGKHFNESEVLRMIETAAGCVRHSAPKRPRMVQVVRALDSDGELSDLSNGVKYGQSTAYDSGQYNQDIMRLRRMAMGEDSLGFDSCSGDYTSKDFSQGPPVSWQSRETTTTFTGGPSQTRATTPSSDEYRYSGPRGSHRGHYPN